MAKKQPGLGYHFLYWVMPPIWAVAATLFRLSWRVRSLGADDYRRGRAWLRQGGQVLACWHQRHLAFLRPIRGTRTTTLVSLSPDGELIARTLRLLGHGVVRGSSTRRAAGGLRGMTAACRAGAPLAFMADGPKGPLFRAKLGPVVTARDAGTGCVIPSATAAWPVLRLRSWDRLQIPLPFAKVVYAFGDPIPVPADATREQLEDCRGRLEQALTELAVACDRALGIDPALARAHVAPAAPATPPVADPAAGQAVP